MKIALIISVSTYERERSLPACAHDSAAIASIVNEPGRFDEVVTISDNASAAVTKERIKELVRSKRTPDGIEELFIYFSGHGCIVDDEFRYVLSDFDKGHPNSTAISNVELDDWARALKPRLFVKIVDACHSGMQYIKEPSVMQKALEGSKEGFSNCYFLFSSLDSQNSFAEDDLSDFTRAIVEAVARHRVNSIGYSDLAHALADRFRGAHHQTPYFVYQAPFTEEFVTITDDLRRRLNDMISTKKPNAASEVQAVESKESLLRSRMLADAALCVTKGEANAFLELVRTAVEGAKLSESIAEYYSLGSEQLPHSSADRVQAARWLDKRPKGQFFVDVNYDVYRTDIMGNRVSTQGGLALHPGSFGPLRETREVRSYSLREKGTWELLRQVATPALPNLPKWQMDITYAIGSRSIVVFYAPVRFGRTGWDAHEEQGESNWTALEVDRQRMKMGSEYRLGGLLEATIKASLDSMFTEDAEGKSSV